MEPERQCGYGWPCSKSCRDTFGDKAIEDDRGWLSHRLVFPKQALDASTRRDDVEDLVRRPGAHGRRADVAHSLTGSFPLQLVLDPRKADEREGIREHDARMRRVEAARGGGRASTDRRDRR
jgi:hypothetical protein